MLILLYVRIVPELVQIYLRELFRDLCPLLTYKCCIVCSVRDMYITCIIRLLIAVEHQSPVCVDAAPEAVGHYYAQFGWDSPLSQTIKNIKHRLVITS